MLSLMIASGLAVTQFARPAAAQGQAAAKSKGKILFFTQSCGYRHSVVTRSLKGEISFAEKILTDLLTRQGYEVFLSQDYHDLEGDSFKRYDAIIFYTTGDPALNREGLVKWVCEGGAFVGIHCATDSFKEKPDYVGMIGAHFQTHGHQKKATLKVEDRDHPATRHLPAEWPLLDEYYVFAKDSFSRDRVHVLISMDTAKTSEADLEAMKMSPDGDYALAWTRQQDKGRVFYTALGHREDVWTSEAFHKHLLGGLAWAMKKQD
jgi:type 1 glutamine amidotransferase